MPLVHLAAVDQLDHQGLLEFLVQLEPVAVPEPLVRLELRDLRVQLEQVVQLEQLVELESVDQLDQQEHLVAQELLVLEVLWELLVLLALQEVLVQLVLQGRLARLAQALEVELLDLLVAQEALE